MANNQDDLDAIETDVEVQDEITSEEERQPAAAKKKGGGLLLKLVVLIIVLGGGFFAWQLALIPGMNPAAKPPVQAQAPSEQVLPDTVATVPESAAAADMLATAPPVPGNPGAPVAQEDLLQVDDGIPLMVVSGDEANAPMDDILGQAPPPMPGASAPAPATATEMEIGLPEVANIPAVQPSDTTTDIVADVPDMDVVQPDPFAVVEGIPLPGQPAPAAAVQPLQASDDMAASTEPPLTVQENTAQVNLVPVDDAVIKRLGDVEAKIILVEETLSDLRSSLEKTPSVQLEALMAEVEDLRNQLTKMKAIKVTQKKKQKNTDALEAAQREVSNYRQGVMPDVVRLENKGSTTMSSHRVKPSVKNIKSDAVSAVSSMPVWLLRSAKPGMAWVSQNGARELKTVSIGDVLPGVGKITLISQDESGRWVVSGTKGFIRQ